MVDWAIRPTCAGRSGTQKMSGWLKISVEFIKTLTGQWNGRSDPNEPRKVDGVTAPPGLASGGDRIAIEPDSQISDKAEGTSNDRQEVGHHDPASGADSIRDQPEHRIGTKAEDPPNRQELGRRRDIVRKFFNDFWSSTDDRPGTFAERLNQAEDYINERLSACGEPWLLDPATRKQLGLPPQSHCE
jgi:hypothetical protein